MVAILVVMLIVAALMGGWGWVIAGGWLGFMLFLGWINGE